jgi:hypothetical protein
MVGRLRDTCEVSHEVSNKVCPWCNLRLQLAGMHVSAHDFLWIWPRLPHLPRVPPVLSRPFWIFPDRPRVAGAPLANRIGFVWPVELVRACFFLALLFSPFLLFSARFVSFEHFLLLFHSFPDLLFGSAAHQFFLFSSFIFLPFLRLLGCRWAVRSAACCLCLVQPQLLLLLLHLSPYLAAFWLHCCGFLCLVIPLVLLVLFLVLWLLLKAF